MSKLNYKYMGDEEFYRKLIYNELNKNKVFSRDFNILDRNSTRKISKCLKRYLIVNSTIQLKLDSEVGYKIKINFTLRNDNQQLNEYIPDSEIVVTIKRYSVCNAFTMMKYNPNQDFSLLDLKIDITKYDFGKDDYYNYDYYNNCHPNRKDDAKLEDNKVIGPSSDTCKIETPDNQSITYKDSEINNNNGTERKISNDYFTLGKI
jgi:hypothetical protein